MTIKMKLYELEELEVEDLLQLADHALWCASKGAESPAANRYLELSYEVAAERERPEKEEAAWPETT